MVPLDPPFFESATVGGVVDTNGSGPRRRLYGTARDLIIGMKFATIEGKLVESGGMVVKNVAGLDMAKLMVGSLGTLAAIAVVNFKLAPRPPHTRSFVAGFQTLAGALALRDRVIRGNLQPAAVDLLNPMAAELIGRDGYTLLLQAGGSRAVIERYSRELGECEALDEAAETALWSTVREFTPQFLAQHPEGGVVRSSVPLKEVGQVVECAEAPVVCRAGTGVSYLYFSDGKRGASWLAEAAGRRIRAVLEYVPVSGPPAGEQWPGAGADFAMMEKIKQVFDPDRLLNPGRLYGRI
jgi:glycolate oxidase FAD binding subunit